MSETQLSAQELARRYYRTGVAGHADTAAAAGDIPERAETRPARLSMALTPSSSHVLTQARKILAREYPDDGTAALPSDDTLKQLVIQIEECEGETLSPRERELTVRALSATISPYGPLAILVENPRVNDIIVRSFDDISIQINRENIQTDLSFPDHESYIAFIERLLASAGKSCTTSTPVVDAVLEPHIRLCVTHESFSPAGSGPTLTLRISRHRQVSLAGLALAGLAPQPVLVLLAALIRSGKTTVLISGEVASGKTTLARALAMSIPSAEAILTIEDTHELILARPFVRTLLTREPNIEGAGRITPAQAIRTGLRMAMNRIVLGEMRDPDAAEAFLDACASGHSGISTVHGRSARDAIHRFELFLCRSQPGAAIETIRRQIALAVGFVIHLELEPATRVRRITEIVELVPYSEGNLQLATIVRYKARDGHPSWQRELGASRIFSPCELNSLLGPPGTEIGLDAQYGEGTAR